MARVDKLERALPPLMKGQGERLIARALMTFRKNEKLQACTPDSIIAAVLEAGEFGFAIDGRLAHAVPYGEQAQMQLDYKGIVAVARRSGIIVDAFAFVVRKGDVFDQHFTDGYVHIHHKPVAPLAAEALGVVSTLVLPGNYRRTEFMDISDVHKARDMSKSWSNPKARPYSPWTKWESEMQKKTGLRRMLKPYQDDPAIARAMELEDREYDLDTLTVAPRAGEPTLGRQSLRAPVPLPEDMLPHQEPQEDPRALDRQTATDDYLSLIEAAASSEQAFDIIGLSKESDPQLEPAQLKRVEDAARAKAEEFA